METLADDTKFPESWLFKHRWNKGKKEIPSTLPNGEKISYLTVGGRTTAIVASVQKKVDERKGERDENSESEKVEEDEEGEEVMDVEEERVKRKGRSDGGKKINQKAEVLLPESAIAEAKHHSEEADRNTKLPTGAKQDGEESQSDSADNKAETPAKKLKRKTKSAPDLEQEDEAEPQPISVPPQSTPTPTIKTANKSKAKAKPKPKTKTPTGKKQEGNTELGPFTNLPTRKSTRKSNPLIPATHTMPPPKPKTKKKITDSPPAAHIVHPSASASSSKPQKRKINSLVAEDEEEGKGAPEQSSNTAEKKVTTTGTSTATVSKKIKTTMRTSLQPQEAGSSSHRIVAKNEDEDIWEGRRRSRRVSGRGVSPVGEK